MMRDFLTGMPNSWMIALLGLAIGAVVLLLLVLYVYTSLAVRSIAKKNKVKPLWLAWIPVANILLLLKIAKLEWQWIFALFITVVPKIGATLLALGTIYVWWQICKKMHKAEWLAILMVVPFANLVAMGYLAWSK